MPDMTKEIQDILSIGQLAGDLQASVPRVRQALEALGILPTIRINNIDHFDAEVVDRLFPLLHARRGADS